ncbi:calcium-activated chloride channel regulator 2 [Eurytemora carolleeae]|uniref:calcium-activated chloride channel regulator 2 n=1 Tax=Eurytemora carolleeae TaxID=1294199 RepID=UPI000C764D44|nr:calcium-activated chloride channel regulator 2 [Eurytemora carolleeae]|eukprot:XP_023336847.1 calcium-activated chloride channel regulator 2-like [Eurytemora affinis]
MILSIILPVILQTVVCSAELITEPEARFGELVSSDSGIHDQAGLETELDNFVDQGDNERWEEESRKTSKIKEDRRHYKVKTIEEEKTTEGAAEESSTWTNDEFNKIDEEKMNEEYRMNGGVHMNQKTGGLRNIVVKIPDSFDPRDCDQILENIQAGLGLMSREVYQSLNKRVLLEEFQVYVPSTWTQDHCTQTILESSQLQYSTKITPGSVGSQPYTQQRQGCGEPGDNIFIPYSYLLLNSTETGRRLGNLWFRLRYGVFGDIDSDLDLVSRQYSQCLGKTVKDIILQHEDFSKPKPISYPNFTTPQIIIMKRIQPKFIILLENSVEMNHQDYWDYIRTACKKFILHDLPEDTELGLVLFNDDAHISHPVGRLGPRVISSTRNGLAFSIRTKHNLSPRTGSCIKCGVMKGIEALQISGTSRGGVIIIISRGDSSSFTIQDEIELNQVSSKHQLQIFTISIPQPSVSELSIPLERLSYTTGAQSYLVSTQSQEDKPSLSVYMNLVDSLREILSSVLPYSSQLIYERRFEGSMDMEREEKDSFIIDKSVGVNTQFNVYFPEITESYIKSLSLSDTRRTRYSTLMDTTAGLHYYTIYNVPWDIPENIGMRWNYSLVRIPSPILQCSHVIQVTSSSSSNHDKLDIKISSNKDKFNASVTPDTPVILYTELRYNQKPVHNARIEAKIEGINRAGLSIPPTNIILVDPGSGDPDIYPGDGVYSRYLTSIQEEGRYTVSVHVSSTPSSPAYLESGSGQEELGEFSRIFSGYIFHISSVQRSTVDISPPSRILDLTVQVLSSQGEFEFKWTAPGDNYDDGKPTSYKLFYTQDPNSFYKYSQPGSELHLVQGFSGSKPSGENESHRILVQDYNINLYYCILGVDNQGNTGEISNIVVAYMPQPYSPLLHSGQSLREQGQLREGLFNPFQVIKEPNKIIMYAVVGVVTVVVFTFLVVMLILVVSRKLNRREDEPEPLDPGFKDNDLVRFSSIDLNIHGDTKPSQFITDKTLSPYSEVEPSFCSADKLFPCNTGSFNNHNYNQPHNHNLNTFVDTYSEHNSDQFKSPIYSKPIPKYQRSRTESEQSPIKSILKKSREDGDGDSDPSRDWDSETCNFNSFSRREIKPNPLLTLDVTQHTTAADTCRNLDVVSDSSFKIRNCTQV